MNCPRVFRLCLTMLPNRANPSACGWVPLPQAAMTTLLGEARALAQEVVRDLPPSGAGRGCRPDVGPEPGSLGARILALEAWLR